MTQYPDTYFYLGELKILPSRNTIVLGDRQLVLQPKVMAVLDYLAKNQDRVVSGEELLAELWKGRIVTPGSVQKSINSLRKALAEFVGDQEMIVHYSKRGYQLVMAPTFPTENISTEEVQPPVVTPVRAKPRRTKSLVLGTCLVLVGVAVAWIVTMRPKTEVSLPSDRQHQTSFETVKEFINNKSRESLVQPHPDNQHLAYVRQTLHSDKQWEIDSQLMIKNPQGDDWQIALSQGTWEFLAWSPDGRYLVAVERWREEGEALTPDFYEQEAYLYTFHIFALDLDKSRLLEKYLLSQWQGRINSLTWWDTNTLEFVGTQGLASKPERYRYSVIEQQLVEVEVPNANNKPLFSQVKDKRTALVLQEKQEIRLELLDEQQQIRRSWQLEDPNVEISWIPDASGILVHLPVQQRLYAVYWNGERVDLNIKRPAYQSILNPVYRPDGKALYYTLESRRQELEWWQNQDSFNSLYTNTDLAVFSPDAQQMVYVVEQGESWHLWLQALSGDLRQLTSVPLPQRPSHLLWSDDGQWIIYKVARQIWLYSLKEGNSHRLGLESSFIEPLAYLPDKEALLVIKTNGEARNVWSLGTTSLDQKQLTFGAVGTVAVNKDRFYFQYRGKSGLWSVSPGESKPREVSPNLSPNSRLLAVDEQGAYFVTGGYCRESSVFYLNYAEGTPQVSWHRPNPSVVTKDFHPSAGLLQAPCRLAPSHILLAQ